MDWPSDDDEEFLKLAEEIQLEKTLSKIDVLRAKKVPPSLIKLIGFVELAYRKIDSKVIAYWALKDILKKSLLLDSTSREADSFRLHLASAMSELNSDESLEDNATSHGIIMDEAARAFNDALLEDKIAHDISAKRKAANDFLESAQLMDILKNFKSHNECTHERRLVTRKQIYARKKSKLLKHVQVKVTLSVNKSVCEDLKRLQNSLFFKDPTGNLKRLFVLSLSDE